MDETDLALLLLLIRDSRAPYSELAKRLKMSVPSVHKRITALHDVGVIKKYTANLAWPYLNAVPVMVWGISGIFPLRDAVERLGTHEATRMVIQGDENSVYLQSHLRSIDDLAPYVGFCRKAASIANLGIGIEAGILYGSNPPYQTPELKELDSIDYRILFALHDDARKPIVDVSKELRVSPKTVRARLLRMRERGYAEFYTQLQLGRHAGALAFFMLTLNPDVEPSSYRGSLLTRLGPRVIWSTPMSNDPSALTMLIWSPTPIAHQELVEQLSADAGVKQVVDHMTTHYDFFETWRDKLLRERAVAPARG